MSNETKVHPSDIVLEPNESAVARPLPAIADAEKGSRRSMWELLMQLRVLLPYLTRLVPLLDRGLLKATPDLSEVRKGMQEMQTSSRDLNVLVRNQTLRLERIDEQVLRIREISEHGQRETREFSQELHALRNWVRALSVLSALLLIAVAVLAVVQFSHIDR